MCFEKYVCICLFDQLSLRHDNTRSRTKLGIEILKFNVQWYGVKSGSDDTVWHSNIIWVEFVLTARSTKNTCVQIRDKYMYNNGVVNTEIWSKQYVNMKQIF